MTTPETAAAWWHLEARFAYALTVWGLTADEDAAAPYARSIVRHLKDEGWRAPLPDDYRAPRKPAPGRYATPEQVTAYAAKARDAMRRQRAAA